VEVRAPGFKAMRQQDSALASAGVTKTFSDTMSGAQDDRPGLAALMEYVREGDTVVVWKLDRLGRNTLHILETVKALTRRGVKLVSVTDGIDSLTAAVRMMMGILGSLAEYERELIKERTALKRATSRAKGTKFGRPESVNDPVHMATAKRMKADGHAARDIAKYLGVSRATLYRYLNAAQLRDRFTYDCHSERLVISAYPLKHGQCCQVICVTLPHGPSQPSTATDRWRPPMTTWWLGLGRDSSGMLSRTRCKTRRRSHCVPSLFMSVIAAHDDRAIVVIVSGLLLAI
jgi:DNA invertase Pin-like site-specific DNA recombinase